MIDFTKAAPSPAMLPMEDAPKDTPLILISPWGQTAVAIWDHGFWRYGPNPGETWNPDYPKAWVRLDACGWVKL